MRRVPQAGQKPRRLQLKARISSWPHDAQRNRKMPCSGRPQASLASNAALTKPGTRAPPASAQSPTQLVFHTGPAGGFWIPIGGAIRALFEKAIPGLKVQNRPGAGLINIKAIEERKGHIGVGNMISTVDSLRGVGQGITQPYKNICHVASLYRQILQVTVRADAGIRSFAYLKGKCAATLTRGNTTSVVAEQLLGLAGAGLAGLGRMAFVNTSDQSNMFRDGQIEASILITTAPASAIMDMANAREIRTVDIDDALFAKPTAANPGFARYTMAKATYPGMDRDNATIQFSAQLVVSCELSEPMVHTMTKTLVEGIPDLAKFNAVFSAEIVKTFCAPSAVPSHPGVARYCKERGAI
jgi:TRAP transporter TAXI family solute receptor